MSVLVIAEHDNAELKPATLAAVTAASQIGGDVDILVAGQGCAAVGEAAAQVAGVAKVLVADDAMYANMVAEPMADLVVPLAKNYDAVLAVANTVGKNFMPRVAAILDVSQISEISGIESPDTFIRPIYAGNAMATVQSSDAIKIITVRTTGFEKAEATGGSAAVENIAAAGDPGLSTFVGEELSKSERPELTAAKIIISGGRGMQSGDNFPKPSPICWGPLLVPAGQPWMRVSCPTIIRLGRPARSWHRNCTSRLAFRVLFSISPG